MAKKLEAKGGHGENVWDDGGAYENVKKVYVGLGESGVAYIKFDYVKDGKIVSLEHGKKTLLETQEFEIDPEDYITSVKVYYEKIFGTPTEIITALVFKTFKGKTSPTFGLYTGQDVELGGGKIVGFHGSSSDVIHSLGVYIVPSFITLPAQGGDAGVAWDDGVHDDVKKIYIDVPFRVPDSPVTLFKADYEKDSKPVLGSYHGVKTQFELGPDEKFELGPGEYLTAVIASYDDVFVTDEPPIVALKFKTNKRESISYGAEVEHIGTKFVLEKKDHRIVGFHGQSSDCLYKLGVHVVPISN